MKNNINIIVDEKTHIERVDQFLAKKCNNISRNRIKNLIINKNLKINNDIVFDPSKKISLGDKLILIIPEPKKSSLKPYDFKLDIIFEDKNLLVVNKPAGISMHPGAGDYEKTLVNAFINYDKNFEIGTYFNVQGKTLEIVGAGNIPDVYTQPFNNLKLNATKTFGQNNNHSISLKVDNLLGDLRESLFDYYGNTSFVFSSLNPGRTISLGYSIKF